MKLINSRDFQKSFTLSLKSLEKEGFAIIVSRGRPLCAISQFTEDEFYKLKLEEDIKNAFEEIQNGECVSHQEVSKKFLGRSVSMLGTFHNAIYANRALKDLGAAGVKHREKILKKIYEKCHFREPFDSYFGEYMGIKAGKYVVICKPDERRAECESPDRNGPDGHCKDTINILCIYPPNGSLKEKLRMW